jgi:hypothetical protein
MGSKTKSCHARDRVDYRRRAQERNGAQTKKVGARQHHLAITTTTEQEPESIKLVLVQGESSGILRALKNEKFESTVAEWACKLYWSFSQDIVAMIPSAQEVLEEMVLLIRGLSQNTDYVELLRAAVGSIANLVKVEHYQEEINATEYVMLALDLIQFQCEDACIAIECCCLIGNLAVLSSDMDAVTKAGGVQIIVDAILRFPDDEVLYAEATRACTKKL